MDPDETLLRSIEEKIGGITEARKEQFRASNGIDWFSDAPRVKNSAIKQITVCEEQ